MTKLGIIEDLVLVKLSVSAWSGKVQSRPAEKELGDTHSAKKGTIQVKVCNLSPEYSSPITSAISNMRKFWYMRTLPWEDNGWRIIPTASYLDLMDGLAQIKTDMWDAPVVKLLSEYETVKGQARRKLNGLFQESKFPSKRKMESMFGVDVRQSAIKNPDDVRLRGLDDVAVSDIQASIRAEIQDRIDAAVRSIIARLREVVADVVERLEKDPQKTKVKYRGLWKSLRRTCEVLPQLNITKDKKIDNLIAAVAEKIAKLDPEFIRENSAQRASVQQTAKDILSELDSFKG